MNAIIPLLIGFLCVSRAFCSEEQHAIWSSIEIATADISRVGKVSVSGKAGSGISKLTIVAFGRSHNVTGAELKKIADFPLAGITITHEAGYEILGGHTVHVRLRRIYYDSNKKLRDETAIVSVSEKKGLSLVVVSESK